jgi:ASC-1-like (ASCH) protein
MKILHLNLYRKYFDAIVNGTKTIEYRDKTDYWKKRIEGREYDIIKFRNGYAKDAPTMLVEYNGYDITDRYEIKLGKILGVDKWQKQQLKK